MLKNLSKRERLLGSATATLAIAALAYVFVIEPLMSRWSMLEGQIKDKEVLLVKNSKIMRDKRGIQQAYSEFRKYLKQEKTSIEEENALALSSIEKIAKKTSTQITNIKPLTDKRYEDYVKFTLRVTIESDISSLTRFIYELQSSEELLKIEKMVLRAKERSRSTLKAVLHVTKISII